MGAHLLDVRDCDRDQSNVCVALRLRVTASDGEAEALDERDAVRPKDRLGESENVADSGGGVKVLTLGLGPLRVGVRV